MATATMTQAPDYAAPGANDATHDEPKASAAANSRIPTVRKMDFDFQSDVPRYWWDNNPVKTMLLAALSATFPAGERFFIDSVRHFQHEVTDPELKKAIRAFIGQEAHHSREHAALNGFLQERGVGLDRLAKDTERVMDALRKLSPERQLAHTVAVEHFTAMLAEHVILNDDLLDQMPEEMARIWAWHGIEESEHKAVAFDVYRTIGGSEWVRISEMMVVSILFPLVSTIHVAQLLAAEGQLTNMRAIGSTLKYMFAKPGVVRKLLPHYLSYYRPDFHPWDHDATSLLEKARKRWLS